MLFDVDKSSDDRGAPMPNTHDQSAHDAVMAKATNSVNYTTQQPFAALTAGKNGQFTIVNVITGSISGDNNSGSALWKEITVTAAHGLTFTPIVIGFILGTSADNPNEARLMPAPVYFSSASAYPYQMFVRAHSDATNVYVHLDEGPSTDWSTLSVAYKLYLVQQTAK